jgi:hypothetical protein
MTFADEVFASFGLPVLQDQHGQAVIYSTPSHAFAVTAIPTSAIANVSDDAAVPVSADACDFMVIAGDLEANGVDVPTRGDEIAWNRGVRRETYVVLPPSPDSPCFERDVTSGALLRIHTKLVSTE